MAPKKNTKMSLGDFLGDQSLGSWADEMEDMPMPSSDSRSNAFGGGERRTFTAPAMGERSFSNRGFQREQLPLPSKPPFNAHMGNLSFDATEGDIHDFFDGCGVESVRIVEDKLERKPKGFGYVTFATLDGLKKALEMDGASFQGRNIRLSVAEPPKDRADARELTDWTRRGPLPDLPQGQQRRPSERNFGNRGFEPANMDSGSERGSLRRQPTYDDGKSRDLGNWERKGPLSPAPAAAAGPPREGGRPRGDDAQTPRERKLSPSWGEGTTRSQDSSRPPRGEGRERPHVERAPTAAELDTQWRARMKPDAPEKPSSPVLEPSTPSSPAQGPPTVRPRLNLQKRTVSEAEPSPSAASSDSKASPFGAARPIDTATREKEVEEKRQLTIRQKRESEAKAREERKAQIEKEKAEKKAAAGESATSPSEENEGSEAGANDEAKPDVASVNILRRATDEGENGTKAEDKPIAQDASANGKIITEKEVKPKDFVRQPPTGPRQQSGSWRRGSRQHNNSSRSDVRNENRNENKNNASDSAAASPATPTAEKVEEDGWSTVGPKEKKGKGRGGARAVAS